MPGFDNFEVLRQVSPYRATSSPESHFDRRRNSDRKSAPVSKEYLADLPERAQTRSRIRAVT